MRTIGILLVALTAGCARVDGAPPRVQTVQLKVDPSLLQPDPDRTVATALLQDLTSAITLLGLPCGQVVSATRQADNDHIASCKDGNRYRVFVSEEGRTVAQKQ